LDPTETVETVASLEKERDLREKFVAALSHDLRTPMTAIKINAQLLLRKPHDTESMRAIALRIVASVDRADKMVQDLLDANRIRAGEGIPLHIEEVVLGDVIASVQRELSTVHGPRFALKQGADAVTGFWDARMIRRILENLAGNAVKYGAPQTSVTFDVVCGEEWVEFSVHNFGNPVSPDDIQTLFEIYHRSDSANQSGKKGWGLGLTLVRGMAEAHRGTVRAESSIESGTLFAVRLPVDSRSRHV
jgi:signal transduction histidine kinase